MSSCLFSDIRAPQKSRWVSLFGAKRAKLLTSEEKARGWAVQINFIAHFASHNVKQKAMIPSLG